MTYWACVKKLVAAKSNPGLSTPVTATLNINIHLEKHFAHCAFRLDISLCESLLELLQASKLILIIIMIA